MATTILERNATQTGGQVATDQAMSTSFASTVVELGPYSMAGIHIVTANTDAVGTWKVQQSIDGSNWVDLTFIDGSTTIAEASGTNTNELLDLSYLGGRYLRLYYTATSGDGTAQAYVELKRFY